MIQSAVADIIGPTVATDDPLGALDEEIFLIVDLLEDRVAAFFRL